MKYFIRYQGMWWRPDSCGYTNNILEAGLYDEDEAREQERCNRGDDAVPADIERVAYVQASFDRMNREVLDLLVARGALPPAPTGIRVVATTEYDAEGVIP